MRGDGRRFIANLRSPTLARKDELWQHFVFTRGGPEWEDITVSQSAALWMASVYSPLQLPFGDFFLVNRGYLQDHQMSFPRQSVYTFGLVLMDRVNGPFQLEIQHIKAVHSMVHYKRESASD